MFAGVVRVKVATRE